jgi:hypothetical protein
MLKHIGKHNQKRAVIAYREIPGEEHMALIVYSDSLPVVVHDDVMKAIESPQAQADKDLYNVLYRTLGTDSVNILQTLHSNGWLKKVPTNQVIVTPNSSSSIRLDELNKLLKELEQGEEAVKRMAELDASRGMGTGIRENRNKKPVEKEVGVPPNSLAGEVQVPAVGALSDADLANQRLSQAENMKRQAEQLLAEAKRLETEAKELLPTPNVKTTRAKKATSAKKQTA